MSQEHHQKIHLNLKDVKHLQIQFAKAATDKLNLYLPTSDHSDPLKSRVSSLVNDFIYEIFEASKNSLDIDGATGNRDSLRSLLENSTNEVEPFDFSLQDQVRKAYQEVEQETIKLTKMRRDAPSEIKKSYEDSLEQSLSKIETLQKELENLESENEADIENHEDQFKRGVSSRLEDMISDYEESMRSIKEIKDV
ncbi:unnamed protein product, partial [Wickerhamomyces anomalus]